MHFSNFENLNLEDGDIIFFTNAAGEGFNGVYRGNYSRSQGSFNFLNYNGSQTEKVYLKDIQVLNRN